MMWLFFHTVSPDYEPCLEKHAVRAFMSREIAIDSDDEFMSDFFDFFVVTDAAQCRL